MKTHSHRVSCAVPFCNSYVQWDDNCEITPKEHLDSADVGIDTDRLLAVGWTYEHGAWVCECHPLTRKQTPMIQKMPMVHPSHVMGPHRPDLANRCVNCDNCTCHAPNAVMLMAPCTNSKEKPMLGEEEIKNRFGFHKGTIEGPNATVPKHAELRQIFVEMAMLLDERLPEGRAKSVAFTELQNASMWSHFAIAEGAPLINEANNLEPHVLDELDRNARAYGFEIGRGQAIGEKLNASEDNPFLHRDWRDLNKKTPDPEGNVE